MLLKIFSSINDFEEFNYPDTSVLAALNLLKLAKGDVFVQELISTPHKFIIFDKDTQQAVPLLGECIGSILPNNIEVLVLPEILGEIPVVIVAAVIGVAATSATAIVVTAIVNIALSIALSAIVSALSPTPKFNGNPAEAQKKVSNLFNNTQLSANDGGAIPLLFGTDVFCTGMPIGNSVTTEVIDSSIIPAWESGLPYIPPHTPGALL